MSLTKEIKKVLSLKAPRTRSRTESQVNVDYYVNSETNITPRETTDILDYMLFI